MEWHEIVSKELARARAKHPKPFNSRSEAVEVVREEFDEWVVEARASRDVAGFIELVQLAAMCQRAAEEIYVAQEGH